MSIHPHPGEAPLTPPTPRPWGIVMPERQSAAVLRVVLTDRSVSFPWSEIRRWEHVAGNPETLVIVVGRETVTVVGEQLAEIRTALDLSRLQELRQTPCEGRMRVGPQVRKITVEPSQAEMRRPSH